MLDKDMLSCKMVCMKAYQVLKTLRISRPTLGKYCRTGKITYTVLPTGRYDYHEDSVYAFLNQDVPRQTVIYARVSTPKQQPDLVNQIETLKGFCIQNGWQLHGIYQDVASGISFEKRREFFTLLDKVFAHQIQRVVISYRDRLSRVGFELFAYLFKHFGTEIVVMSDVGSVKLDSQEVFEEIVSLLHCFAMKLYSKRRQPIVEGLCQAEE